MQLEYKPDFLEACRYWEAFWQKEIIDRPCIAVVGRKDNSKEIPMPPYLIGADGQYEIAAKRFDEWASTMFFGGEAIPFMIPDFGPDQFSAFIGAELDQSRVEFGTTWAVPFVKKWEESLPLRLQIDNRYWQNMLEFVHCVARVGEGKFLVGMIDLHSNMDCLAAIRGIERLLIDIVDHPEIIDRAMNNVRNLYTPIYEGIYDAGKMARWGTIGTLPYYCKGKSATISCDSICMISPVIAQRFVIPALIEEAAYLDHAVYHCDGVGALVHLDNILAIPGIDVIQWAQGDNQPPLIKWMDLFKKIQKAKKGVHICCSAAEVKLFHKELCPEGVFYYVTAASQREAEELIAWLKSHT